jgi:hypothetical protein
MTERVGTTNDGRTIITTTGEEPKSARASKRYYQLWKFARELNPEEIEFLITKRRNDIKYEQDDKMIRILRTEISILADTRRIIKRELKEKKIK